MEHFKIFPNRRRKNVIRERRRRNRAINRNRAAIRLKKFHQQVKQRRFARATLPDKRNFLAAFNRQAEIVKNSDVDADELSKLVDDVKEEVEVNNVTDHTTIVNIINNYTVTNNINITNSDIENLATSIEQVQNVQGDVNNYESEVSNIINSTDVGNDAKGIFDGLFN